MRFFFVLLLYRLLLPLLFIAAFPGWLVKMLKRGGFGTRLGERAALYTSPQEDEPCGQVHLHAVSVGETLLALKLIRQWRIDEPERRFVLATGTATGHAVATGAAIPGLRVTYSPLDFPGMVRRYLNRFEPSRIILVEGEAWPHLLLSCRRRNIPVALVNARMSPRSARRYQRFASVIRPLFSQLGPIAVQEADDIPIWKNLGVLPENIHLTGSLKFDPGSGARPSLRSDFQPMLDAFGPGRPIVLAASTHQGEESWIANAIREAAPHALPVIVPRHAERRAQVKNDLEEAGFKTVLRSSFVPPAPSADSAFVIDSTGELRDWTAHASVVVIGKSFLSTGGQNPAEAILARKPVIFGPHMENFEPLSTRLLDAGAAIRAIDQPDLVSAIRTALQPSASDLTENAASILSTHEGATRRILSLFTPKS